MGNLSEKNIFEKFQKNRVTKLNSMNSNFVTLQLWNNKTFYNQSFFLK
jgi:hypothetical protein